MAAIVIDRPSNGARQLARALDMYRVSPDRAARTRHRSLINWGVAQDYQLSPGQRVINHPRAVRNAVDKIAALFLLPDMAPPFWTRMEDVVRSGSDIILCRRNFLSEGRGITVVRSGEPLVRADFYTKYIRKVAEYRVHVVNGQAICIQQKRRRSELAAANNDQLLIRNHNNGWVFAVNDVDLDQDPILRERVVRNAVEATARLGLDFAAIDLIVARRELSVYFLEANTRPGIESPTVLDAYRTALSNIN